MMRVTHWMQQFMARIFPTSRRFATNRRDVDRRVQQVSQRIERLRSELDGYDDDLRREWWRG